jgi:hypothetical protein
MMLSTTEGSLTPSSISNHKSHDKSKITAFIPSSGTCNIHLSLPSLLLSIFKSLFTMPTCSTLPLALLERNSFSDYRSGWPKALGDLMQYRIVITAMIPAPTCGSSSSTTATVTNRLWALPVGFPRRGKLRHHLGPQSRARRRGAS